MPSHIAGLLAGATVGAFVLAGAWSMAAIERAWDAERSRDAAQAMAIRLADRSRILGDLAAGRTAAVPAWPGIRTHLLRPLPADAPEARAVAAAGGAWCGPRGDRLMAMAALRGGGVGIAEMPIAAAIDAPPGMLAAAQPSGQGLPAWSARGSVRLADVGGAPWMVAAAPAEPQRLWPWLTAAGAALALGAGALTWRLRRQGETLAAMRSERADALAREIDVRRRTEGELFRARGKIELLAAAVARSSVGVVIAEVAADGQPVVFANPAAGTILDRDSRQLVGESLARLLGLDQPGESDQVRLTLAEALRDGEPFRGDLQMQRSGRATWVAAHVSSLRDHEERAQHRLIILTDVTARRQAEAALRESEERFRRLADAAPLMIWMSDAGVKITYINQAYATFSGDAVDETVRASSSIHPEDRSGWQHTWSAAFARRVPYEIEYRQRSRGGEWRWLAESGVPRSSSDGSFAGFVGVCIDVTDRRQLIDGLRSAKESAETADAAKSTFLATMSHEIRTPLHGILGMTGLLLEEPLPPHQRELAETVRTCGEHLLGVVNDVLDFSRIAAGRLELDVVEFDLRQVVEEALATLGEAAHGKGLELAARIAPGLPARLLGDAGRIRQILVNLVGNAVKFTAEGRVVVRVGWRGPDAAGALTRRRTQSATLLAGEARIQVEDTGPGIAAEVLGNLFQPFVQGDSGTTRQHGGTGLGLVICRRLAELMSGTVVAESQPGRGTTMTCTMRLVPVPGPAHPPERGLAGARVLVIDERPEERGMVLDALEDLGCIAIGCADESGVPAALAGGPVALVIADCAQTGAGILAAPAPVLALATLAERAAQAAGGLPVITRPVRRAALREAALALIRS